MLDNECPKCRSHDVMRGPTGGLIDSCTRLRLATCAKCGCTGTITENCGNEIDLEWDWPPKPKDTHDQRASNLNDLMIASDTEPVALEDFSTSSGSVRVVLKHLRKELIKLIKKYPAMCGCVAWFTEFEILEAMAGNHVAILVQKEDFLRPDSNSPKWITRLRHAYQQLGRTCRFSWPAPVRESSICGDPDFDAVRCVGMANTKNSSMHPRMHHKFLVLGDWKDDPDHTAEDGWIPDGVFTPKAVWTGSFNFTATAGKSFENAVIIEDEKIATAYAKEFAQLALLSEPLDWDSVWCAPEWRIGT